MFSRSLLDILKEKNQRKMSPAKTKRGAAKNCDNEDGDADGDEGAVTEQIYNKLMGEKKTENTSTVPQQMNTLKGK